MFCVKFMTCCDLEKYQGHHVLATLCVQMLYFQFILVGGLLTGSDTCIMAKIDAIWLTFVSYGPVVTLKNQSKVTDLISILSCIILVFLLIWLQSSHWISRHSTYNQYFVCLDWGQGHTISSFSCLKFINVNSVTIHRLVLGIWHRKSPFCLNFEV